MFGLNKIPCKHSKPSNDGIDGRVHAGYEGTIRARIWLLTADWAKSGSALCQSFWSSGGGEAEFSEL